MRWSRILAVAVVLVAGGWSQTRPAEAAVFGLADQTMHPFASPAFRDLRMDHVRFVVPWDAALTNDARASAWIDTALRQGLTPLVALEKSRSSICPGRSCRAPSVAQYEMGVAALLHRWPQIRELTPWNEPNHRHQPTTDNPRMTAEYYNAARRRCPACRLVAGDVLDSAGWTSWLATYRGALDEAPAVWGVHNYYDANYFGSRTVDALLRDYSGEVWLTETGGIVRFSPPDLRGWPYDERRAADSINWLFGLVAGRPRVARMYLYHWQADPANAFDSGLVGPGGVERPGLAAVRRHVGTRSGAGGGGAGRAAAKRRRMAVLFSTRALRLVKRGLRVRMSCVSAPSVCKGRLVVSTPKSVRKSRRARARMSFRVRRGHATTRTIRLSRNTRRRLSRPKRLSITYCLTDARRCKTVRRPLSKR